jgi:signal transduction histidine kinase
VGTGWVILAFFADIAFRPMHREIATYLGEDPPQVGTSRRLRARFVGTVPAAAFFGSYLTGSSILGLDSPSGRLVAVLVAATVVTTVFVIPVVVLAGESLLDPIADLIAGTQRVAKGDYSVPVPPLTNDELGSLARSFNVMQSGLRERASLRDRNAELVGELRASRERIVATADAERRRLERDLHDGAQQNLVLLNLKLGVAERQAEPGSPLAATVAELRDDLGHALTELRNLAHGIYPQSLQSDGLPGALKEAAERAAIQTVVECDGAGRYPAELEAAIYFCCLEALQNAAKHAGHDAHAIVRLVPIDSAITFEVADSGPGFDAVTGASSHGIQNMRDRIGALGGELTIYSAPGQGTTVRGTVPLTG